MNRRSGPSTPDGRPDIGFGEQGRATFPAPEAENSVYPHAGALDPQGRLLLKLPISMRQKARMSHRLSLA